MKLRFYQEKTKITLKKSDYFIRFECFLSSFNSFLQTAGALTFFKLCLKHSVNPSSSIRRILFVSTSKPRPSASKLGIFFFTSEIVPRTKHSLSFGDGSKIISMCFVRFNI